jgi:hypothetical protein
MWVQQAVGESVCARRGANRKEVSIDAQHQITGVNRMTQQSARLDAAIRNVLQ